MKIGDFVKGTLNNDYSITNENMTKGLVTDVFGNGEIRVLVMEHTKNSTGSFIVDQDKFEVIGHQKEFNRDEVLEFLKNGCKKAILDYNLRGANLRGADLDFSCLPLRCGGLKWKIDVRLAAQLAYHLCSMQCSDSEYIKMRNSILDFANKFHRVNECGHLEKIEK